MTRDKFENASQVALDKDARIMRLANMTEDLQARVALQDKEIRTLGNAGVNLLDRAEAAEAKVAELTAALTEIAKQKHPLEMTLQWKDNADFEDGYAACVDCARAALKKD